MSTGLRVWDASGNLVIDETTRLGRILGQTQSGTSGGTINNAGFLTGTPFAVVLPATDTVSLASSYPSPTFSGSDMNWGASGNDCLIIYGVY